MSRWEQNDIKINDFGIHILYIHIFIVFISCANQGCICCFIERWGVEHAILNCTHAIIGYCELGNLNKIKMYV